MKEIGIIILNWNGADDTIECLESLDASSIYDIYLVDNGSADDSKESIIKYIEGSKYQSKSKVYTRDEFVKPTEGLNFITLDENLGFAGANNYICNIIKDDYKYVMLLNNDTYVVEDVIEKMRDILEKKDYAAITCDIRRYSDHKELWNAGGNFTWYGDRLYFSQKVIDAKIAQGVECIDADFITGCAPIIKGDYIRKYGLFTDRFFHGEEDFNFCKNVKKNGYKCGVYLQGIIYHKVGSSIKGTVNKERERNSHILHYSNRIIDFKLFYGKVRWTLWREMYLFLIFLLRLRSGYTLREACILIKYIRTITNKYDRVDKRLFDKIMSLKYQ